MIKWKDLFLEKSEKENLKKGEKNYEYRADYHKYDPR